MKKPSRRGIRRHTPTPTHSVIPADLVAMLVQGSTITDEIELTCDEFHALLDEFVELVQRGADAAGFLPLVDKHLVLCPECKDEYLALKRMLELDQA